MNENERTSSDQTQELAKRMTLRDRLIKLRQLETADPRSFLDGYANDHIRNAQFLRILHERSTDDTFDVASAFQTQEEIENFLKRFISLEAESLPRNFALASLNHLRPNEIAEIYPHDRTFVSSRLTMYRDKILEPQLLTPIGLTRISQGMVDKKLIKAAEDKTLPSFKILNKRYVSKRHLKEYEERKEVIDQNLLDEGYSLLMEVVTEREYEAIIRMPEFNSQILKRYKILYIQPTVVMEFREKYVPNESRITNPLRNQGSRRERQRYYNQLRKMQESQT